MANYNLSLDRAIWIDVNTRYTKNGLPDRLPNAAAIVECSLFNLFNCTPGERSRTFQPTYGSYWRHFIHEPINDITAMKMQIFMLESIAKWEPRIKLNMNLCSINADTNLPGYHVRLVWRQPDSVQDQKTNFEVKL